ncbi:hypothetical protein C882_1222 [Caenispirillum salinarum AK4]|uniref:Uncharacterized protein n=1 Tax=Caenispirillum salinarum AK4 TaxID=1238182 RepID=K9HHY3_9PROT|nr:hypothetical protein C882_1222 [Caenispirillum salinarum AK4]
MRCESANARRRNVPRGPPFIILTTYAEGPAEWTRPAVRS